MLAFALLWWGVYLMQKTSYNNHYYLLALVSSLMVFLPAHRAYSIDARKNPAIRTDTMYAYVKWGIILQLFIVYTYAAIAKIYGDWIDFTFLKLLMEGKSGYPIVGDLFKIEWFQKFIGISGLLFDLLVVPALLWKPTRKFAFTCSVFFHLFNSIVFQIGIFPYLALAFNVFFFEEETIRKIFFKKKSPVTESEIEVPEFKNILLMVGGIYFVIQLLLPIRHHFIPGDVLWTEEGHRLSWRMMLRSRNGHASFLIVDKKTKKSKHANLRNYLTKKQRKKVGCYPDFMWQFAQHLKAEHAARGEDIEVYVDAKVRVNGRRPLQFTDKNVDLANIPWSHLRHHDWILPSPLEKTKAKE